MFKIDSSGRKRPATLVICSACNIEFLKETRFLKYSDNHYCCRECSYEGSRKRIKLNCSFCNKEIKVLKSRINNKTGLHFCSRICKDESQKRNSAIIWNKSYSISSHNYRKLAFNNYEHKCYYCSFNEIEILQVHHIDEDRTNNNLTNLQIVCPNCHTKIHKNLMNKG